MHHDPKFIAHLIAAHGYRSQTQCRYHLIRMFRLFVLVVIQIYQILQIECFDLFIGMFVFVLENSKSVKVFVLKDVDFSSFIVF